MGRQGERDAAHVGGTNRGIGRRLRRRLAATTILAVAPFMGYGRQAHAACDTLTAPNVVCDGTITGFDFTFDNLIVSTDGSPQFVVQTDGVVIDGYGHIQFNDSQADPSIINNDGGNGLDVISKGDDGDTPGAITIVTNATITGSDDGIDANNYGTGDLTIEANGTVTGRDGHGIDADNEYDFYTGTFFGRNLTITTGTDSVVTGSDSGIAASNNGSGYLDITVRGTVTGEDYNGIGALNSNNSTDLRVMTVTGSVVSGENFGIRATNRGYGDLSITANGRVTGETDDGIYAYNAGVDLTIETGAQSVITGDSDGISARNEFGTGNLAITAYGTITGERSEGISARNGLSAIDLTITTGAGSTVTGRYIGVVGQNNGSGDLAITAYGEVGGVVQDGIQALNSEYSQHLTITTGAESVVTGGGGDGIDAENFGRGYLKVAADGMITGGVEDGIEAANSAAGTYVEIATGAGSSITGASDGIDVSNDGNGRLEITIAGAVTGRAGSGVEADNDNDLGTDLTITTYAGSQIRGFEHGIDANNDGSGVLDITVNGAVTGTTMNGVLAFNDGGGATSIAIGARGLAEGNIAGINALSAEGQDISITNDGTVRNLSAESSDQAIIANGGAANIETNGTLIGTVTTDTTNVFDDTVDNFGVWNTADGINDFGADDDGDVVTNAATGTLIAADDPTSQEETEFDNLEGFTNAGLVTLADGQEGDHLHMDDGSTDYEGEGGTLAVDAVLGPQAGTNDLSDMLFVGGDTSGTTFVRVNVLEATGANTEGIAVVEVDGSTSDDDFVLENGPFDAGFFTWDLRRDGDVHELFTSGIGVGSYEFAAGISGAQEVWHQSAGTLLQRQADLRTVIAGMGVTPVADYAEPVEPTPVAKVTPGFWFRGVGAWIDRDDEENGFTLDRKQTIWGGLAGFDFGTQDVGDALMFGVFGGYLTSDLDFKETNSEWTYEGPTVGAYATYLDHAFYVDATVKADFLDIDIDPDDLSPGSDDADTDAVNLGARLDTGYKFGQEFFVEPQATLAVVHTEIDDVDIFGGTVEFDDATSVRGRLGLRLGFEQPTSEGTILSGDVTASAWQDFSDDNEVSIADTGIPTFGASVDPGQTYGDVALGFSVVAVDGWSGFIRGNYLFASDYEAVTGGAGVRYAW